MDINQQEDEMEGIESMRHRFSLAITDDRGFSLTELMVVIVIIGILALIAIPRFLTVTTRAKMTEAKNMLRQVHVLQEAYYYEYDRYASDLAAIGFEQVLLVTEDGTARYVIAVESASDAAYVATATSIVDFDKDGTFNEWVVGESGVVSQRVPD
jgi:type IV pilus assembly protein PilE